MLLPNYYLKTFKYHLVGFNECLIFTQSFKTCMECVYINADFEYPCLNSETGFIFNVSFMSLENATAESLKSNNPWLIVANIYERLIEDLEENYQTELVLNLADETLHAAKTLHRLKLIEHQFKFFAHNYLQAHDVAFKFVKSVTLSNDKIFIQYQCKSCLKTIQIKSNVCEKYETGFTIKPVYGETGFSYYAFYINSILKGYVFVTPLGCYFSDTITKASSKYYADPYTAIKNQYCKQLTNRKADSHT